MRRQNRWGGTWWMASLAGLLVAVAPLRPAMGASPEPPRPTSIAGEWQGAYRYDDPRRFHVIVPFTVTLSQQGATVQGKISEPRSDFGPSVPSLSAALAGNFESESGTLSFRKVYDYDGHVVHYTGALDRAGTTFSGTWRIGTFTGTWYATRRN